MMNMILILRQQCGNTTLEADFNAIDFYNKVAEIYNRDSAPEILNPKGAYQVGWASQVATLKPKRILEIGCGTGRRLNALVNYYDEHKLELPEIVAVDPAPRMLEVIHEPLASRVELINSSDTSQFDDNSFDLVYTSGVLCSVPNSVAALICNEALRISIDCAFHTDTPKSGPHLNNLDILKFHIHPDISIVYWNTLYPYPIANEAEHQIIISSENKIELPDEFPLRSKVDTYSETWRELMENRLSK